MKRHLIWGIICFCLNAPAFAEDSDYDEKTPERIKIEFDLILGDGIITYSDATKTRAKVSYAPKKKIVAYRDDERGNCFLEKIKSKPPKTDDDSFTRFFRVPSIPLDLRKAEQFAGKKISHFCGKHKIILLEDVGDQSGSAHRFPRSLQDGSTPVTPGRSIKTRSLNEHSAGVGHAAGVDYHASIRNNLQGPRTVHPIDITSSVTITTGPGHQLWYSPSVGAHQATYQNTSDHGHSGTPHEGVHHSYQNQSQPHPYASPSGHGFKTTQYPPSSGSKVQGHYPPSSAAKPIGHYPPSSTSKTQQHSGVPSSGSLGHYPPSSVSKTHQFPPSSASKSADHYPPSSFAKPHGTTHYSPSGSKTQQPHQSSESQGATYYPPSSTSKTQVQQHSAGQGGSYYPPSSTSKTQQPHQSSESQGAAYYPPSSTSKTQVQQHSAGQGGSYYPPSSTSKTHFPSPGRSVVQYGPSSSAKPQHHSSAGQHYPSVSTGKTQHFAPSSGGRTLEQYVPSSVAKTDRHFPEGQGSPYYPPSSTSKTQPGYYPPSSAPKPQQHSSAGPGISHYPPSSTSKVHAPSSSVSRTIDRYPPSSFAKPDHSIAGQGAAPHYPPSSTSKTQQIRPSSGVVYPPSSTSKTQHGPSSSAGKSVDQPPPSSFAKPRPEVSPGPAYYSPSSSSRSQIHQSKNYPPSSFAKPQQHDTGGHGTPHYPPSSTSKTHSVDRSSTHFSPSSVSGTHYYPPSSVPKTSPGHYPPSSTSKFQPGYYPPSSTSKTHSGQPNVTTGGYPQSVRPVSVAGGTQQGLGHLQPSETHFSAAHPGNGTQFYPGTLYASTRVSAVYAPHFFPSSTSVNYGQPQYGQPQSRYPSSQLQPQVPSGSHHSPGAHHTPVLERPLASPQQPGSYPPSSTSKTHYPAASYYPPSSASKPQYHHSEGPSSYPPSSTSKVHFVPVTQSSGAQPAPQIPVPPVDRTSHGPHQHGQQGHFPPSASSKQPDAGQGAHSPYYPPSSTSKHKFSSPESYAPAYYPPSSTSKHHYDPQSQAGRTQPSGYEPSSFGKSSGTQGYAHVPYHGPYGNGSTVGQHHIPPQFPPSSISKIHPSYHNTSSGGHQYGPTHYNGTDPHSGRGPYGGHYSPSGGQGSLTPVRPCSQLSITTRTILSPNGVIQRPVAFRNNGASPCGVGYRAVPIHSQSPPCSSVTPNGLKAKTPCNVQNPVPRPVHEEFGAVVTDVGDTQAEVLQGIGYPMHQFSRLEEEKTNGRKESEDKSEKDVEEFEEEDKRADVKTEADAESKTSEEEVKEGDILEPGDRILGKDGYTISEGLRGRVVSVTGQVGKTRTDPGKDAEKKSNSGHFRYNSDLGRYVKDNSGKSYSNCQGEPTFTCTEFLGSNGRAKICKPNPRRNPDGTPC